MNEQEMHRGPRPSQPRGRYNRISDIDKLRLIQAHNSGADYVQLAETLGINVNTARGIIARGEDGIGMARGGRREETVVVTPAVVDLLVNLVQANPAYTLVQLQTLVAREGVNVSTSSIARALDLQLIHMKKLYDLPAERNSERVKAVRREYANWLLEHGGNRTCLFVDETCFNVYTRRTRGRAANGQRALRQVNKSRGPNLNLTMAISSNVGIVYYELQRGSMNAQRFNTFLDNLSVVLGDEETFVIMDNAPCHQGAEMPDDHLHIVRKLPPYSPFMNPIEEAFSALKAAIKARLNEPDIQQQLMDPRGHILQRVNIS